MVQNAKQVALSIGDHKAVSRWRDSNNAVSDAYMVCLQMFQFYTYAAHFLS